MISETQPDIVVISSPAEAHYENARDVLEAGRSLSGILVEKPLVYYPKKTPVTSTSDACHLSRICLDRKVLLDTTVQLRILAQDYFKHFPPQGCNKLVVEWDCSKEDAIERWRDIGPHVVAMIEEKYPLAEIWAPQKRVVDGDFVINGNAHLASGGIIGSTEGLLPVSITIGARGKAQRRFGYEGNVCQVAYDKDRDGYVASIDGGEVFFTPDPMMTAVRDFADKARRLKQGQLSEAELKRSGDYCVGNLKKVLSV
jgi:hypothetical protein